MDGPHSLTQQAGKFCHDDTHEEYCIMPCTSTQNALSDLTGAQPCCTNKTPCRQNMSQPVVAADACVPPTSTRVTKENLLGACKNAKRLMIRRYIQAFYAWRTSDPCHPPHKISNGGVCRKRDTPWCPLACVALAVLLAPTFQRIFLGGSAMLATTSHEK